MVMLQGNFSWIKIGATLITLVLIVGAGALIINVFFPNVVLQLGAVAEDVAYRATGFQFDWNGDGKKGGETSGMDYSDNKVDGTLEDELGEGVEGWGN